MKVKYRTICFNPTCPQEASDFLNKKYEEGWRFVCCEGGYYYFERIPVREIDK
jgi:hypothetical protein